MRNRYIWVGLLAVMVSIPSQAEVWISAPSSVNHGVSYWITAYGYNPDLIYRDDRSYVTLYKNGSYQGSSSAYNETASVEKQYNDTGPKTIEYFADGAGDSFYEWAYAYVTIVPPPNQPPMQAFDWASGSVSPNGVISGGGWAADNENGAPVNRVEVWIDGARYGNANLGGYRADVANAFGRGDFTYSGYSFSFGIGGLPLGNHTVMTRAYDNDGAYVDASKTFAVVNTAPTASIWANAYTVEVGSSTAIHVRAIDPDGNATWLNLDVMSPISGYFGKSGNNVNALAPDNNGLCSIGPTGDYTRSLTVLFTQKGGYQFRAAAGDPYTTTYSPAISISVVDTTPPSAPGQPNASSIGTNSFVLSWSGSSDYVGVTAYRVRLNSGVPLAEVGGTSTTISGLTANTAYAVQVQARDAAGNWSAWSTATNVQTARIPTTFSFGNLTQTYNGSVKTATVTANPSAATYSASLSGGPNVGSYAVSATATGSYIGSGSATLVINPAGQSITFSQPPAQTFGTPLTLNATASSGLPVSFQIVSGPATVAGNVVEFTGTGSVTVRASQSGNANYQAASPVSRTFTVAPRPTTFTFSNLSHTYDGSAKSASVTRAPTNATFTSDLTKGPNAGSYTVSATATGNYTGSGSATLVINKASQSIQNFPQPASQTYGTPLVLAASATSGLAVSYSVTAGPAVVTGNVVSFTGIGNVTVRATQAGNANYQSTYLERTFAVKDTAAPSFASSAGAPQFATPELLATGSAELRLRWYATDNLGIVRFDYSISRGGTTLQSWSQAVPAATFSSYTHTFTGLAPGTAYTISIKALDASNNAVSGQWVFNTCSLDTPPTPEGFAFELTTTAAVVRWAEAENNASLTHYNIQLERVTYSGSNPVYTIVHNGTVAATPGDQQRVAFNTATVPLTLVEAGRYRFKAQAVDAAQHTSGWGIGNFVTLDKTPPAIPSGVASSNLTQTGLQLVWNPAADNSGVVKYEVHQLISGSWVPIHLNISGTSQIIGGLSPGSQYTFAVRARDEAVNAAGASVPNYSALSASCVITTLPPTPVITSPSTWSVPRNAYVNPYQITAQHNPTSFSLTGALPPGLIFSAPLGKISGTPTQAGTSNVTLGAANAGGAGQKTLAITVVTNGLVANAAVTSAVSSNWLNGKLYIKPTQTITLQPSGSAINPFVIDWVDHEMVRPNTTIAALVQPSSSNPFASFSYTPTHGEGTYVYRVRVVDTAGDFIEASAGFVVDDTAPTTPTGFGVASGGAQARSLKLSWNASSDANGVASYRIERLVSGGSPVVVTTTSLSATFSSLQPGTNYSFTIVALDAAGNVSGVATTSATTLVEITSPNVWSISAGSIEGFALLTTGSSSSYSVTAGTLPPGLTLNPSTGIIAGAATTPGTYTFTLGAHNSGGVATQSFTITVNAATSPGASIGFEPAEGFTTGSLKNQVSWAVPQGSASVASTSAHTGANAVELPGGSSRSEVTRAYTTNPAESVTFVDLRARPAANAAVEKSTTLDVEAARVGFKLVGGNAVAQAFNGIGGQWESAAVAKPVGTGSTTSNWMRLTLRLDYQAKAWDLYIDGQLQLFDLGFADPTLTAFDLLKLRGAVSGTTYLDDVLVSFSNPLFADNDRDGMPNSWETERGLNPNLPDRDLDTDHDGLTNFEEYLLGTHPGRADTDNDGVLDGQEVAIGSNPIASDMFWKVRAISGSIPAGANFLIIDAADVVHGVTTSTLSIQPRP